MTSKIKNRWLSVALLGAAILSCLGMSGCQSSVGGTTLPSGFYLKDDLQYFPRGPEFPLTREAAQLKEARAEASINR